MLWKLDNTIVPLLLYESFPKRQLVIEPEAKPKCYPRAYMSIDQLRSCCVHVIFNAV